MASTYSPWIYRKVLYRIPGLFKKCPGGNHHWRWDRICYCRSGEHCGDWHGGILDMKTGRELQQCECCRDERKSTEESDE